MSETSQSNWRLIILLWVAGLGVAGQYAKISVIFEELAGVYPGSDTALGFALSLVGAVGIVLGVAGGVMVAKIGFRRAILWGLWAGAGLALCQAFFPLLPIFLGLRLIEGATHLALVIAIPSLIARHASPRDLGLAMSLWSTFFAVSFTLLSWFGLALARALGLEALMLFHAAYMAAMALILARALPQSVAEAAPLRLREIWAAHGRIYRSPAIMAPGLGWLAYTMCFLAFLTLIPPFIEETTRGAVVGAVPLVAVAASLTLGVFCIRWMGAVQVIIYGFAICAGLSFALVFWPAAPVLILLLGVGFGLIQGASFAAVPVLNPAEDARALANGGLAQMGNLGNTIGTPLFILMISVAGYTGMMLGLTVALILGAVAHVVLAAKREGRDGTSRDTC